MGTTLTGTTPQDTYDSLIKVTDNGPLSGTAKYLSDGLGNDSALALSTAGLGVGTTSLSGKFHAQATNSGIFFDLTTAYTPKIKPSGAISDLQIESVGSGGNLVLGAGGAASIMQFFVNGTLATGERMRITSTGLVGIGTSAPAYKLSVNGGYIQNTDGTRSVLFGTDGTGALTGTNTNHYFRFITNDAERLRITEDGYVRLSSGSGGIQFNSDTAAANALDDYEEGTFTPILSDGTNNATMDVSNTAFYTKIGRVVYCSFTVSTSSLGSVSGNIQVNGLPFAQSVSVGPAAFTSAANQLLNITSGQFVSGRILGNATSIQLWLNDSAAGMTQMQATEWSADGYANFTGYYFV